MTTKESATCLMYRYSITDSWKQYCSRLVQSAETLLSLSEEAFMTFPLFVIIALPMLKLMVAILKVFFNTHEILPLCCREVQFNILVFCLLTTVCPSYIYDNKRICHRIFILVVRSNDISTEFSLGLDVNGLVFLMVYLGQIYNIPEK